MHPQPPSNEDGYFGRSESEFDQFEGASSPETDENSWLLDAEAEASMELGEPADSGTGDAGYGPPPAQESVQALPGEFGEAPGAPGSDGAFGAAGEDFSPADAEAIDELLEGYAQTEEAVPASFVEPEPASRAVSRALVPAGAALLISFSGIAVWAFMKKPVTSSAPVELELAAPDVVDSMEGNNVELVAPLGTAGSENTGRVSFQRDGSKKVIGGTPKTESGRRVAATSPGTVTGTATGTATVRDPREPGELSGGDIAQIAGLGTGVLAEKPVSAAGDSDGDETEEELVATQVDLASDGPGDEERPSFSSFGGGLGAANTPDELAVVEDNEGGQDVEFEIDSEVADEVLDAFAVLEDDLFLPQSFLDQFVLSIDPIDDIANIYGDVDTYEEVDSFAELGFDRTQPFDSTGFGDFGVSQWEGHGGALAQVDDEPTFDVDVPFGMFDEEFLVESDDTVASVDVGPEETVVAIATEVVQDETFSDVVLPGAPVEVSPVEPAEVAPAEVATEVLGESLAEVPAEVIQEVTAEIPAEIPGEIPAEMAAETPADSLVEVAEASPETSPEASLEFGAESPAVEFPAQASTDESEMVVAAEVFEEAVQVAEVTTGESVAQPVGESIEEPSEEISEEISDEPALLEVEPEAVAQVLDLDAANARLDAMFGPVETPEVVAATEPQPEMVEETVLAPEPETLTVTATDVEPEVEPNASEIDPGFDPTMGLAGWEEEPADETTSEPAESIELEVPVEEIAAVEVTEEVAPESMPDAGTEPTFEPLEVEAPGELAVATEEPLPDPLEVAAAAVEPEPEIVPALEPAPEPEVVAMAQPEVEPEVEPQVEPEPEPVEVLTNIADEMESGRRTSALRRIDQADVWKNRTVPKTKLQGDRFVLTPNVGNVRVIFDGGETVDGRLHGVGAGRIVLDTKLGRMTLDSRRADRIDRLGGGRRAELRSPGESYASTKGLDRVKVRAAGGVFYGHLVSRTPDKVTLLLDGGVRVTLDAAEVETSRARRATSRLKRN